MLELRARGPGFDSGWCRSFIEKSLGQPSNPHCLCIHFNSLQSWYSKKIIYVLQYHMVKYFLTPFPCWRLCTCIAVTFILVHNLYKVKVKVKVPVYSLISRQAYSADSLPPGTVLPFWGATSTYWSNLGCVHQVPIYCWVDRGSVGSACPRLFMNDQWHRESNPGPLALRSNTLTTRPSTPKNIDFAKRYTSLLI